MRALRSSGTSFLVSGDRGAQVRQVRGENLEVRGVGRWHLFVVRRIRGQVPEVAPRSRLAAGAVGGGRSHFQAAADLGALEADDLAGPLGLRRKYDVALVHGDAEEIHTSEVSTALTTKRAPPTEKSAQPPNCDTPPKNSDRTSSCSAASFGPTPPCNTATPFKLRTSTPSKHAPVKPRARATRPRGRGGIVGKAEGTTDGNADGSRDGGDEPGGDEPGGDYVGGDDDGLAVVGAKDGRALGRGEGCALGRGEGCALGRGEGCALGRGDGPAAVGVLPQPQGGIRRTCPSLIKFGSVTDGFTARTSATVFP